MVSDDQTNWFTITSFHTLAKNVAQSINKGDRITVSGTIKIRDWDNGERSGTSVEMEANSIGHDLNYGTSKFDRTSLAPQKTEEAKPKHKCNCNGCDRSNN
jgi:single-strand DNA-binding protein